jgi:multiple sugar transport system permease protein
VTIPMLSPVILFTLVIGIINGFQYFTEAYVAGNSASGMTPGDPSAPLGEPQGSLLFYSTWLYQQGFRYFHMGYASAMAWLLFAATMAMTLLLVKSSDRWVHYGSNLG